MIRASLKLQASFTATGGKQTWPPDRDELAHWLVCWAAQRCSTIGCCSTLLNHWLSVAQFFLRFGQLCSTIGCRPLSCAQPLDGWGQDRYLQEKVPGNGPWPPQVHIAQPWDRSERIKKDSSIWWPLLGSFISSNEHGPVYLNTLVCSVFIMVMIWVDVAGDIHIIKCKSV